MTFVGYLRRPENLGRPYATKEQVLLTLDLAHVTLGTASTWPETQFREVHSLWLRALFGLFGEHNVLEVYDARSKP